MLKKNLFLKRWKEIVSFISLCALLMGAIITFNIVQVFASAAVSAVTLTDTDMGFNGIDGRDFTISWTLGAQPTGYANTQIYLVPDAKALNDGDPGTVLTACTDSPANLCVPVFTTPVFNTSTITLTSFVNGLKDSNNGYLSAQAYRACILTQSAIASTLDCSAAFTPTSDVATDTQAPFIMHTETSFAIKGRDAVFHAIYEDDQTVLGNPAASFKLFWGADVSASETPVNANVISGKLANFPISSFSLSAAGIDQAGESFEYYILATDAVGNSRYFCKTFDPSSSNKAGCQAAPFRTTLITAPGPQQAYTISGTIKDSNGTGINVAKVYLGNFAMAAVATPKLGGAAGEYIIGGIPSGVYDIFAYTDGYCNNSRFGEVVNAANLANININLMQSCGGFNSATAMGGPMITFFPPPDGVLTTEDLRIGWNQPLNPTTVNDANSTAVGSNVYLTTTADPNTKLAGTVTYCTTSSSPGCSSLSAMDSNVILFNPTADLSLNTQYTLNITSTVTSDGGQSVQGSRPEGGAAVTFRTRNDAGVITTVNFGTGGNMMPPYVKSVMPGPGIPVATNTKIVIFFNEQMDNSTLTTSNIKLVHKATGTEQSITVATDPNIKDRVVIIPAALTANFEYEVRVLGAVKNSKGVTMSMQLDAIVFSANVLVGANIGTDTTPPTIYPSIANGATEIAVNRGVIDFGFNEPIAPFKVISSIIIMNRGSTSVPISVEYNESMNNVRIIPDSVLSPNTTYTITYGTEFTDLAGVALTAPQNFSFTTASTMDSAKPKLKEARCDDYSCKIYFTEQMNSATSADTVNWPYSVLNPANITLTQTTLDDLVTTEANLNMIYDASAMAVEIKGLSLSIGATLFTVTVSTSAKDLSSNPIDSDGGINLSKGLVENSKTTFGSFGGEDMGMFGPPPTMGTSGEQFVAGKVTGSSEFGNFTVAQFADGTADRAYPFNPTASQDVNVFQVRSNPGVALTNGNKIVLTFPAGTDITNAVPDTLSPFYRDFNEDRGVGTVTFDTDQGGGDGIDVDTTARTVTIYLDITGTPNANDSYTIDLRKITNPAIPKGPAAGGYTVSMKAMSGTTVLANKTSMPYFIEAGGSYSITVKVYATSASSPDNVAGSVMLFGGGPSGPMDKTLTITAGKITAIDGTAVAGDAGVQYTGLKAGCYFFGTEPNATLGGIDYRGQISFESVCVDSNTPGTPSATKNIILTSKAGTASVPVTVKLVDGSGNPFNFGGKDIDIFAGGPGDFTVKTLSSLGAAAAEGYTIRLSQDGMWNIGVGPAMSKSSAGGIPTQLSTTPPPPASIIVGGVGTGTQTISSGMVIPPGVAINTTTKTITFTFATADKTISGTVTDGTTGLANANVFVNKQGFGMPTFATTNSAGAFSLRVSDYGTYEIGAWKDGLPFVPPNNIDLRTDGNYFKGKQITIGNPLIIKLKKPSYSISGKVLDFTNNPVQYANVFATDTLGNTANGGTTDSSGNYTLYVDPGTWTVKAAPPLDKTDICGTFSKSVTISTESASSQNITASTNTCYTLSGTVTVGGSTQANKPVMVIEWDTTNNRPVMNGLFKPTSTNSSGVYSVNVNGSKTYHVQVFDPNFGELYINQAVATSGVTNAHISSGTTGNVTFAFTGGTLSMEAWVEISLTTDKNIRLNKKQIGLNQNLVFNVKEGTYNYRINIAGVGEYSGTVATGATATIDLSASSLITLSGTIKDDSGTAIAGALVMAESSTGVTANAKTNSSGVYSINVKPDTYKVSSACSGYVPQQAPATVALTGNTTNYDFGGAGPDQPALEKATEVIRGTIYQSNGTTPVAGGFVSAENSTGLIVTAPIDPQNGTYSLPATAGTWTIEAISPLHAKTTLATPVTVTTTDQENKNITLTSDITNTSTNASSSISGSSGGSFDDTGNTDIKITASPGALTTENSDVNIDLEKKPTAPDTTNFNPVDNMTYTVSASTDSGSIKALSGCVTVQLDYTDHVSHLPAGISENEMKVGFYNSTTSEWETISDATIDTTNNTATFNTCHFSEFALLSPTDLEAPATPTGLAATAASSSQIDLTWTAVEGATSYDIYRSTTSGGTYSRVGSEPTVAAVTSYSDTTGLSASTIYYYEISALNGNGESAASSAGAVYATTSAAASTPSTGGVMLGGGSSGASTDEGDTTDEDVADEEVVVEEPVELELSTIAEIVYAEPYTVAEGEIAENMSLMAEGEIAAATFEAETTVTTADGEPYAGEISPPVAVSAEATPPKGFLVLGSVYEVGPSDLELHFDKPVTLRFPLPETAGADDALSVYYFNETIGEWTDVGGEIKELEDGSLVIEVSVDHFTKFVVMEEEEEIIEETAIFEDIVDHWAKAFIEDLYNKGIVSGYDENHYGPDNNISRAEFTKIAIEAFSIPTLDPSEVTFMPFIDVDVGKWYATYIQAAYVWDIVGGYKDSTFKPNQPINRAEAMRILFDAAKIDVETSYDAEFTDVNNEEWYAPYINYAAEKGIVSGYEDGTFGPSNNLKRCEVAKIVSLLLKTYIENAEGVVGMVLNMAM